MILQRDGVEVAPAGVATVAGVVAAGFEIITKNLSSILLGIDALGALDAAG